MDPLFFFVASIVGSLAHEALRTEGNVRSHYPKQGSDFEPYLGWIPMRGRNVVWWVEPGEAVWIEARYLRPISGNIFYADKLGAVAQAVRGSDEPLNFYAPYGQMRLITPDVVAESIRYALDDVGDPFTTGDPKLDRWLVDREDDPDPDPDLEQEMEERLARAVRTGRGDLGKWSATVRDGNHRTFGAVLGGEERVAIRLYDNDAQWLRDQARKGALTGEYLALAQKAQQDTGQPASWMSQTTSDRPTGWRGDPLALLKVTDPSTSPFERLMALRRTIAAAAQTVYDQWDPDADEEDGDPEFGHGGICDRVASEIAGVLSEYLDVELEEAGWDGDDHAAVIAVFPDGRRFLVDIPPGVYEHGSGYSWTKIPGVTIEADDVVVDEID
jgi:hypothetical protein